ncbi:hypothetical protein J6590_063232 [Homalodisca vitripennis]|nr:hypothetical protein J6590_063232 [Homalodisca vitripennis]
MLHSNWSALCEREGLYCGCNTNGCTDKENACKINISQRCAERTVILHSNWPALCEREGLYCGCNTNGCTDKEGRKGTRVRLIPQCSADEDLGGEQGGVVISELVSHCYCHIKAVRHPSATPGRAACLCSHLPAVNVT